MVEQLDQGLVFDELICSIGIALANLVEFCLEGAVVFLGKRNQAQQTVRHSTHRGNDDTDAIVG